MQHNSQDIYMRYWHGLQTGSCSEALGSTSSLPIREPIGNGIIQRFTTNSGMEIVHSDYRFSSPHTMSFSNEAAR